jgi:surface antigen
MPTASFKDGGRVCRHIRLLLTRGERVGAAEGIACRPGDGR